MVSMVRPFPAMYAETMASEGNELDRLIGGAQLICLDAEPGQFAFFAWHNVLVFVWPTSATGAAVERMGKRVREVLKQHPKGESHVHMVKSGAPLPTSEARAGFVRLMHEFEHSLAAAAVCLIGSGFWASALQAAVTGMRMLAPHSFEMHIHNDMESVVEWLPAQHLKHTGVAVSPQDLLAALKAAFAAGTEFPSRGPQRAVAGVR